MTRNDRFNLATTLLADACKGRDPRAVERAIGSWMEFGDNCFRADFDTDMETFGCLSTLRDLLTERRAEIDSSAALAEAALRRAERPFGDLPELPCADTPVRAPAPSSQHSERTPA